ncbi:MAG: nuclear transport factor 2 family protein [Gammaproteobacteria bacterium]
MTAQVPGERLLALTEELVAAYNAKDFARLANLLSPNLRFCHHNRGFAFDTRDELIDILRRFASDIVPDRKLGPAVRAIVSGNTVLREQTWSGTARGDIPGMAKAGESFSIDIATVLVFKGEVVAEYHDYG